ncbi:aminotransferase class V-fold PLP-dependent enzyme [bacterium]|nr:aminotransferase class V-fold PLP-dependent enzyme [bacterium]
MYCEGFFREGTRDWPDTRLNDYPAFGSWEGIEPFKQQIAGRFAAETSHDVFLASRSAQLVRVAARTLFRTCRNVLTSDLNWPHWQAIVAEEAARSRQQVTIASVQDAVFNDHLTARELARLLTDTFITNECDAAFLPSVSSQGIHLPIHDLLSELKQTGQLRFALVDAAQSFSHLPEPTTPLADVTITGCHKWLCGSLPLGIAVCGRRVIAEQIRAILETSVSSADIDDPLLRFSQQICHRSVDRYSETVNVAPLFSANAAIRSPRIDADSLQQQSSRRLDNVDAIVRATASTAWKPVEPDASLRTGIVLMRSSSRSIQSLDSDALRSRFRDHGIALSTYDRGLVRISAPGTLFCPNETDRLCNAFSCIA